MSTREKNVRTNLAKKRHAHISARKKHIVNGKVLFGGFGSPPFPGTDVQTFGKTANVFPIEMVQIMAFYARSPVSFAGKKTVPRMGHLAGGSGHGIIQRIWRDSWYWSTRSHYFWKKNDTRRPKMAIKIPTHRKVDPSTYKKDGRNEKAAGLEEKGMGGMKNGNQEWHNSR